jgi:capsid protein
MLILGADGKPASSGRDARMRTQDHSWSGIYEAATRADFRGWFYVPSLDPVDQQDSVTRRILAERSDWLYKNVGATTMVIDGLALDEVGTGLWPKWNTASDEFNRDMTEAFHFTNFDPGVFSADGQNDFYSQQFNIRRMIRLYGDAFGQMIKALPETGRPAMHIIPGWRVDNSSSEPPEERRRDGVKLGRLGRPIDYRVSSDADGQKRTFMDVPASEMLHFHDPFLPGQVRGVPALASVAKRLFRREDIHKAMANGTLARERMGFALQSAPKGSMMPPVVFAGQGETKVVENEDGSKYTVQKIFGDKAGEDVVIPEIPPGAELKLLESSRPGTAVTEFLDSLLREVAWATTYPPEYIFFLANGARDGGAAGAAEGERGDQLEARVSAEAAVHSPVGGFLGLPAGIARRAAGAERLVQVQDDRAGRYDGGPGPGGAAL